MLNRNEPYCVIGDPIQHSISPPIHNFVFEQLGHTPNYEAVHVRPENLSDFVENSQKLHRPGFNITIPHKESIIPLLDEVDPYAKRLGAVNTVILRKGKYIGYNTDVFGCKTALIQSGCDSVQKAIILGSGGAARAAIEALIALGAKEIRLYDIIKERAVDLCSYFSKLHPIHFSTGSSTGQDLRLSLSDIDILINATPVGMWPRINATPLSCPDAFPEGATALDMVYRPLETRMIQDLKIRKARTISGLKMLVAQAIAADELYLEHKISSELLKETFDFTLEYMNAQP